MSNHSSKILKQIISYKILINVFLIKDIECDHTLKKWELRSVQRIAQAESDVQEVGNNNKYLQK